MEDWTYASRLSASSSKLKAFPYALTTIMVTSSLAMTFLSFVTLAQASIFCDETIGVFTEQLIALVVGKQGATADKTP